MTDQTQNDIRNDLKRIEKLRPRSYFVRLISILGIGTFFDSFDAAIIGTVLLAFVVYLHVGTAQLGAIAGASYVGWFFGAYIFGRVAEKYGKRKAFIVSLIQYSIFMILTGISWSYGSVYALRLISGIGLGGESPAAAALISEFAPTAKRGVIVMGYETAFAWGVFLAPLIGVLVYTLVGEALGWRVLFYIGVIPLIAGIVAIFALWESPRWLLNKGKVKEAEAIIDRLEAKSKGWKGDSSVDQAVKVID